MEEKNNQQNIDITKFRHRADIQLRFNDVDVLGHVNNTVYFSFYDTGKALYFSAIHGKRMSWEKVVRIIANINCAFMAPIIYGEEIEVLTRCTAMGNKSFTLEQLLREKNTGEIKSHATTVMVSYDPDTHRSQPLPETTRREIAIYEGLPLL